ncbi:F-box protein at4g00755 [Phtheirospermum japonicum]|uniref:F-box protein at4g00755 n=1 Tax=Phtheirospermum japonicum TaxID=374723 RepID=A0A830BY36_9LAMI|nr:F-box protein at4g00755 [Phtheirospermum japonicum]
MDHQRAVNGINFLQCLESDMSVYIMSFLDDPSDLVRAYAVSRFWREFVITNRLAKQLCIKTFPQLANIVNIVDESKTKTNSTIENASEREILERDHKVYASLHWAILKANVPMKDCLQKAVSASSTDRMPDESVESTVGSMGRLTGRASYWSSKGQSDPTVPETLIYKMKPGIWVITEIDIQPFEAFFQPDNPIYSAKSVRFRLGHLRPLSEIGSELGDLPLDEAADDKFRWTYTSPEFPMMQESHLQQFVLPEPVLCVEGFLQVELLGRVQRQETDGLFYLCVNHVRALARLLYPAFDMEVLEPYGFKNLVLKHVPEDLAQFLQSTPKHDTQEVTMSRQLDWEDFVRGFEHGPNFAFLDGDDDDWDEINGVF